MSEQQSSRFFENPEISGFSSGSSHIAHIECIDGNAVQMEVKETDTVGTLRQRAIQQMGLLTDSAEKYVVMTSSGEPQAIDPAVTVSQLLQSGEQLRLQLISLPAFGPAQKSDDYA